VLVGVFGAFGVPVPVVQTVNVLAVPDRFRVHTPGHADADGRRWRALDVL